MNEAARKTWEMLQANTGHPLSIENIETTRAAFPIALDNFFSVISSDAGLLAIGSAGNPGQIIAWVGVDGTAGYKEFPLATYELKSKRPNAVIRFWREACWRVARAWDALCGREE